MNADVVIEAHGLGKKFCRSLRRSLLYGLLDIGAELGWRRTPAAQLRRDEFWALRDAAFTLRRGESLGIIGQNGAGKSTLLKLVAGLIKPDTGRVTVRGRVGALIALGAGFNPILSGRENIQIAAAIAGFKRREIQRILPAIIDFAELDEFIDSPVQNYSSGMAVRLGFAAATCLAPDVMLADEVLAVGDTRFQRKCFDRIAAMRAEGTSFIVVSHAPWQIESVCDHVAVVDHGRLSDLRSAKDAQTLYHDLQQRLHGPSDVSARSSREGTHALSFDTLRVLQDGHEVDVVESNRPLRIEATVRTATPVSGVRFRFEVCAATNAIVALVGTIGLTETRRFDGRYQVAFTMSPCLLTSGWYYVNAIAVDEHVRLDTWRRACEFTVAMRDGEARALTSDVGTFIAPGAWEIS